MTKPLSMTTEGLQVFFMTNILYGMYLQLQCGSTATTSDSYMAIVLIHDLYEYTDNWNIIYNQSVI
jgi:hypothetical protein